MKKKIFKASSFLSLVLAMSTMTTQAQQVDSTATNAKDSTKKVDKVMDEVVVVAYGSQRVKNLTGSMATVGGALLADKPFSSVDKALQGQVAGLQVSSGSGAAGSSTDIRLRGIGSISASSSPLWVIDGVIASSGDWSSNTTTQNVLSSLNPDDIASITVLKDAAATAIYGSRAANGVIIVTTKKGQAGTTKIDFVGQWGGNSRAFYNQNNRPMTTSEYMKAFDMALQNAGYSDSYGSSADIMVNDFDMDTTVNTNWYNLVNRTGNQAQYNLSLSGGNEKTQFYASSGYFTQDASTINSNFKRYNGSINVHHKASDRLTLDIGLNGAYSKQQTPMNGGAYGNPNLAAYFVPSWYSPYKSDGSLNYGTDEFPTGGGVFNPLVIAAYDKYTSSQLTMRGFVSGKYQILNNLSFTSKFSSEYFDLNEYQYNNPLYGDGYSFGGAAYAYDTKVFNYTWTNLFNYKLNLNSAKDINLDITAGQEAYKHNYNIMTAAGKVMPQNLEKQDLTVAGVPTEATTGKSYNAMNSYLANAVFNIKDRYVISGSFRRDGSSVFGANHRWGNFFSVGGAWNINNEDFLKNNTWIDVLKLRASYGENGNAIGFGDYSSIQSYNYGSNYNNQAGMIISNVGNPDLTWEKNKIFDVGIDWGFLHNRLSGSIDYYNRATSNLLIWVPLSYTTGYYNSTTPSESGELMNVGSMRNRGLEFTINGTPIKTKDFSWDVSFNISHNNNKVTKLYNGNPISNGQFRITEGHNIQEYYLREWAGVDKTNGNALWYTNAADTATTSNISNAGYGLTGKSAMPKYFGGFTNTFTYKNFSLTAVFNYNFGNYVEDSWANYYNSDGTYYGSFQQSNLQLQAWTPENTNTNVPKLVYGNSTNSRSMSTRFLYKGNYIRLRTLQFDYRLPKSVLAKFKLTNVDFFFSATNWWTFATDKNIPFDPESGVNATTNLNIPINKTITGGVKIGL